MFTGLTVATLLGVPAGAWLGHEYGWRTTFWAVTDVGVLAALVIAIMVPRDSGDGEESGWRASLAAIGQPTVLLGLLMTVLGAAVLVTLTGLAVAAWAIKRDRGTASQPAPSISISCKQE